MRVLVDGRVLSANGVLVAGATHNLLSMLFKGLEVVIATDVALVDLLDEHGLAGELKQVHGDALHDGLAMSTFEMCVTADEAVAGFADACGVQGVLIGRGTAIVTFGAGAMLQVF